MEAVSCEPVSSLISLLSREKTGKFQLSGAFGPAKWSEIRQISNNFDRYSRAEEQGNEIARAGKDKWHNREGIGPEQGEQPSVMSWPARRVPLTCFRELIGWPHSRRLLNREPVATVYVVAERNSGGMCHDPLTNIEAQTMRWRGSF